MSLESTQVMSRSQSRSQRSIRPITMSEVNTISDEPEVNMTSHNPEVNMTNNMSEVKETVVKQSFTKNQILPSLLGFKSQNIVEFLLKHHSFLTHSTLTKCYRSENIIYICILIKIGHRDICKITFWSVVVIILHKNRKNNWYF